jgi:hypothetical protein
LAGSLFAARALVAAADFAVAVAVDLMAFAADQVVLAVAPVVFVVADAVAVARVDVVAVPVAFAVDHQVSDPVAEVFAIVFVRHRPEVLSDLFAPAVFFCQLFPGSSG